MSQLSGLPVHQAGVLRQELDSLVRAIWLLHSLPSERKRLAEEFCKSGEFRKIIGGRIQDAQMVELTGKLYGWSKQVYKFGCAFIHLSNLHDYLKRDPFLELSQSDRSEIAEYIERYHFVHLEDDFKFDDIVPLIPRIFDKIRGNLEYEIADLEKSA